MTGTNDSRLTFNWACRLLLALFAVIACGSGAKAKDPDQVQVGIARTMSDAGYYIADAMGYFHDENLAVTLIPFKSAAQMIAPLGIGELDVGGGHGIGRILQRRPARRPRQDRRRRSLNEAGLRLFVIDGAPGSGR